LAEISARSGASTLVGASKLNADVRTHDVKELFRSMNWWKSIGDDNVRSMVLSAMSESHEFISRTSELLTAILRSRDIPERDVEDSCLVGAVQGQGVEAGPFE
jgi:hypothetical protein